ncbi:3-oxoadipate enol-lactonase [soil metagenome]
MMEGTIVTGDGCPIFHRFDGPEGAPILMLSNSLGTDMQMWAPQMARLSQEYRVLRYDQRGHGQSGAPAGSYSIDRLGRDIVELLDALSIDRVDFCGLSLGGMTGQWLGLREPRRLRRLILANTSSYMGPPTAWDARINLVLDKGMAPLAQASVERWFTQAFATAAPEAIAQIGTMLSATTPQGYAGCCAGIRDMDLRRTVGLIDVPTLVIGGLLDPATPPPHSEALAQSIHKARLVMLEAAHLSNVERPQEFLAAMLDHLSGDRNG